MFRWLTELLCHHNWLRKHEGKRGYLECEFCLKVTGGVNGWPL